MAITARWIWRKQAEENPYNQTVRARRAFVLPSVARKAELIITADSYYRLHVNGEWVNDGPGRSWPEHYEYDVIDIAPYLRAGKNEIEVIARYFGAGTFHQVPKRAGLLVQLDVTPLKGRAVRVISDESWEVADATEWNRWTPKVSIQMEPWEMYDARREGAARFTKAQVVCAADKGPWKDLQPRTSRLLTRVPMPSQRMHSASVVAFPDVGPTFLLAQMLHPGLIEANYSVSMSHALATVVISKTARKARFEFPFHDVTVNGKPGKDNVFALKAGRNFLLACYRPVCGHDKDTHIRYMEREGLTLENPLGKRAATPWCYVPATDPLYVSDDMVFINQRDPKRERAERECRAALTALAETALDESSFLRFVGKRAKAVAPEHLVFEDASLLVGARRPIADASALVEAPDALMHDNAACTVVSPAADGDIELLYDLGVQTVGYYSIDLVADEGTVVDVFSFEYINQAGELQLTWGNRNGMRYVCKQGRNTFTSLRRRAGRYLFVILRNMRGPVRIRKVEAIESTYPVSHEGRFACSDKSLDRVWEMSERTLKLCMEDTFTDCPLYEQTLWVGDARNEAMFALHTFGATDLAKRCAEIAGQSVERYPMVGCQVPSTWDCILPAWSFLWGISLWDYYFFTGDKAFIRKMWPYAKKNLREAQKRCTHRGLFSAPYWNLLEWSTIDDQHKTVTHNGMLLVGAIDAAHACAKVLGDKTSIAWLKKFRAQQVKALNALWDSKKKSYLDSVNDADIPSAHTSQHNNFLSILHNVVEKKNYRAALQNSIAPPEGMTRVASGFASMFHYEALDKAGESEAILDSIREEYRTMLEADATTVWEVFPTSLARPGGFPTRSHCHAWSSAPVYFLPRVILGIRQTAVAGEAYTISPWLSNLKYASGRVVGAMGGVEVHWEKKGRKIEVSAKAAADVKLRFQRNASMDGFKVLFNGKEV